MTYWNPSAERIFGVCSASGASGRPVAELVIPERLRDAHAMGCAASSRTASARCSTAGSSWSALRADGSEFPVEMTISALRDAGRWTFHAFIQDISERVDGERERERLVEELRRALRGSERRFEAIVGSLGDPGHDPRPRAALRLRQPRRACLPRLRLLGAAARDRARGDHERLRRLRARTAARSR